VLDRSACDPVVVPAGSSDALARAIADACEGGVVYLKAGEHAESKGVTINKSVRIVGEPGAVLKFTSKVLDINAQAGALVFAPALHVSGAPATLIQNVEIVPAGTAGGSAILLENAPESAVVDCKIRDFQMGIYVEKSDRVALVRNTVQTTGLWQTGQVPQAHGIVVANGKSAYIGDNTVSNSVFGIWACDLWGTCERNKVTGNLIGIILCKVPVSVQLPGGAVTGAANSATLWKTRENNATGNIATGYLVIDGANNNLLENNDASGNGAYDYEITGDTKRFGFLTPFAFKNTLRAKAGQKVKNCGPDNTVSGGVVVDLGADVCN
jgi:Right handed beta helix region